MTHNEPWTDDENQAVVDAYFVMLDEEAAGRPYNKAATRRALMAGALHRRSHGSIEFKFCNVSAILEDYSHPRISGYLPRFNYQQDLERTVVVKLQGRSSQLVVRRQS